VLPAPPSAQSGDMHAEKWLLEMLQESAKVRVTLQAKGGISEMEVCEMLAEQRLVSWLKTRVFANSVNSAPTD